MNIWPVVDLLDGQVVRGVAGRRAEYRPIESPLCRDARPESVAKAFADLGFREAYLADLDAIGGGEPAWEVYRRVAACGLRLNIDAGLSDAGRAAQLAEFAAGGEPLAGIVAGLESLDSPLRLREFLQIVGPQRLIFSLDLKGGQPLTTVPDWQRLAPIEIADAALASGVQRMILLDLARVGVGKGVGTETLCREIRTRAPYVELIAGGGVRDADDLETLAAAGCQAALVASAVHDGRVRPA